MRGHGQLGIAEARAASEDDFAGARLGSGENKILVGLRGLIEDDRFTFDPGVFLHHDCVGARGQGRAGHDEDASAGLNGSVERAAGAAFAYET